MGYFTNYSRAISALFLLITLYASIVSGFSTKTCSHDQIETKLKTTLNCIMKSQNKNMDAFLNLNRDQIKGIKQSATNSTEWCELIDEEISCFTDNLGTCFNQKINSDFATMMEWYYNKQPYMECNRIEGLKKEEIERKAMAIVAHYKQDVESLKSIVNFDKTCSTDELIGSVKGQFPCFMKHFFGIMAELMPHIQSSTYPESIPVCENVVGILSTCFQETQCLSQLEMNMVRDFLATYYNVAMSFVVQLSEKFGSMSKFMEVAGVGVDDMQDSIEGYPKMNEQMKSMMMKGMDLIVEDYKNDTCQKSLKQFTMMVDDKLIHKLPLQGGDGIESYVVVLALILSLVVVILVAMLGWVFYAYRNPTTRSGQILIRSTAKNRLFRSASTSTV